MASLTDIFLIDFLSVFMVILALVYAYFSWTYRYWKRRNVPYLETTIPLGNMQNPYSRTMSVGQYIALIYEHAKSKGWNYCGLFMMATRTLFVRDLELIKHILTKDFGHFTDRGTYTNENHDPLSCHLFSIGGKKWRNLRVKLTPTFTSGKLKTMFQTIVNCGLVLEQYIEDHIRPDEAVDIKDVLAKFSTDIIGSCAFGLECNSFKDSNAPFRLYGKRIFERTRLDVLKIFFGMNFPNFARALGLRIIPKDVSNFFIKVVDKTVAYREKNNIVRKDFLQLLIELKNNKDQQESGCNGDGKSLSMLELTAQCFVFFFAGFETSSTTMTFTLFELAQRQEIQDKVRAEIKMVLEKYDKQITYESISELKYMGQVIDETLRLYPPVPLLTRLCVQDYKLPGTNVIVEKGTSIMISVLGIHKDSNYYKNPDVFDPDRFSEENRKNIPQYAYIPFGEGPRICIGGRFGIMQTKVGLMSLLRKYRVTLNNKTEVPLKFSFTNFITSVDEGIWFNIEKLQE